MISRCRNKALACPGQRQLAPPVLTSTCTYTGVLNSHTEGGAEEHPSLAYGELMFGSCYDPLKALTWPGNP